ncbi:MAG: hypothetical protein LC687_02795 [Actinobacteria bacterium]|nr:hypothetical protein [Actinomycetota bacterium]
MAKKSEDSKENQQSVEHESAGNVLKSNIKNKSRSFIIVLLAAGVLITVGAFLYNEYSQPEGNDDNPPKDSITRPTFEVELQQLTQDDIIEKTEQLRFSRQYEDAIELIKYQDGYDDSYDLHLSVSGFYISMGSHEQAIQHMMRMEERFGITKTVAENIADQAVLVGDNDLARQYYELAIIEIENNSDNYPIAHLDIEDIEKKLEKLDE